MTTAAHNASESLVLDWLAGALYLPPAGTNLAAPATDAALRSHPHNTRMQRADSSSPAEESMSEPSGAYQVDIVGVHLPTINA